MRTTIQDIAKMAGVSIATVSHVINHTRYVSPEVVERVENIINSTDYKTKLEKKRRNLLQGKQSEIAVVVPSNAGTLYAKLIKKLADTLLEKGYLLSTYFSGDNYEVEQKLLYRLARDKNVVAIVLSPCRSNREDYEKFLSYQIPVVFLERKLQGAGDDCVLAENEKVLYRSTQHLIKYGHEKISILLGDLENSTVQERLQGYRQALDEAGIMFQKDYVLSISHEESEAHQRQMIQELYKNKQPTAIITCGNRLTYILLRVLQSLGVECPHDVSIIGFGDEEWCELIVPPLTVIKQKPEAMALCVVDKLMRRVKAKEYEKSEVRVPLELLVRKSTQMIGRGPFGERAFSPDDLVLSDEEKRQLRDGDYKVAISFHYSGTAWQMLHENGIRQTLEKYGIMVLSVSDAHFDPYLQVTQLEGIGMQQPDAVIAIPADDTVTSDTFKKLSKKTKLIFLSNVPEGFGAEDYVTCVSVNERENGRIAGTLMGDYFKDKQNIKVGFINHGRSFYGTHLRDMVATQIVCENYSNIEVVAISNFQDIDDSYELCKNMIKAHPDIQGLYISWDRPALQAIKALEDMGRTDVAVFTFDLDEEIGKYLAQNHIVKGMSTQRPYEQGVAAALATAKALLGKNSYKYVGVPPYLVQRENFLRAWKDIMHEPAPKQLEKYFEGE